MSLLSPVVGSHHAGHFPLHVPFGGAGAFIVQVLAYAQAQVHLHAAILQIHVQVQRQGYALVPLDVYLKDGRMKMNLGLCVGKHLHDKRASTAERDVKREMARMVRTNNRGE